MTATKVIHFFPFQESYIVRTENHFLHGVSLGPRAARRKAWR